MGRAPPSGEGAGELAERTTQLPHWALIQDFEIACSSDEEAIQAELKQKDLYDTAQQQDIREESSEDPGLKVWQKPEMSNQTNGS